MKGTPLLILAVLFAALVPVAFIARVEAAEVVIVGDAQLKLVAEVISGIKKTLKHPLSIYSPTEARGELRRLVEKEQARLVIALGREAQLEAQSLPEDIPVIYGFVLTPPVSTRKSMTGIYMATPVKEYADLLNKHLRSIKSVAVIGSREQLLILGGHDPAPWQRYSVKQSVEFVETLKQLSNTDAILLLPDVSLLTPAALEETYLLSFRKGIPLLGISERQVRDGALLALVVDLASHGRMIGEYASEVLRGTRIEQFPPTSAGRFELYLNTNTAEKMGISIPHELLEMARRVYP